MTRFKEGQILVRLEDDEFRAQYEQAKGAADNARAYLEELQNGSRPEEIQQAQHNLDEARATLANDQVTLDRTRDLANQGVVSKQALDDATAKFEADQQRVNSLDKAFQLAKTRSAQGRDCTCPGRSGTGSGAGGLCQVLARRHGDPRTGYGNHS